MWLNHEQHLLLCPLVVFIKSDFRRGAPSIPRASSVNNVRQMAEWKVDISGGRHSFPFVYGIRLLRGDEAGWLAWHSEATVAQPEAVWTGINNQSACGGEDGRLPRMLESCWQITQEIPAMNAHGQTPLALTLAGAGIQIRVHLISRLTLFMSAASSCIISVIIDPWPPP